MPPLGVRSGAVPVCALDDRPGQYVKAALTKPQKPGCPVPVPAARYPLPVTRYPIHRGLEGVQLAAIQSKRLEGKPLSIQDLLGVKMSTSYNKKAVLTLSLLIVLSACAKKDEAAIDSAMAPATGMADSAMTPAPAPALTDANIVFILDNANMLDSAAGSVAAKKGTSADVREYGQMMMRDHHSLRQQGQDLAKKLGVTPEPPANDDSKAALDRTMALLNGAAKGKDFDKAYIDHEVTYHKAVLETATTAMNAAQNAELKNLIQKAAPAIQAHLDRAQAIQSAQNSM